MASSKSLDSVNQNSLPLVSIGMPIFNEARFLIEALDSLTTQTYKNMEILISDNASTDGTEAIVRQYAEKYPCIRYHRFEENRGAGANFRHVLGEAKGKYFMWAAGHDRWSGNFVESCVEQLERYPAAVLAFAEACWIGADSKLFPRETGFSDTRGLDPISRYFTIFWGNMNPILGMIRRDVLYPEKLKDIVGVDLVFLTELSLRGDFVLVRDCSWERREFREERTHDARMKRYKSNEYKLTKSFFDKVLPLAKLPFHLVRVVMESAQPISVKLCIILSLPSCFFAKYIAGKYFRNT